MNSGNIYSEISSNSAGSKKDATKSGFQGESYTKMAKSVIIGTIISLFSSVILLIVFAFIINLMFGDPDKVINIFTGIIASAGALIGGFRASKMNGSNGLISGLMTGIATSIVIFIIMIFSGKHDSSVSAVFRIVLIICQVVFATVGGIFAVNSHGKKNRNYSAASFAARNKKK
ncbi:MAG: TIGR04086 family membrane protein [Oscillospiraceae bacterium]|nr:TIGR04086 family membrane protein [Oscillospiraceae bacterium]